MAWLSTISSLLLVLVAVYCIFLLLALGGLFRVPSGRNQQLHKISVVVAARNEERTIGDCLQALLAQDYDPDHYEIVVVNDGSWDGTTEVVHRICRKNPRVKLLNSPPGHGPLRGKKRALQLGIQSSNGDIILITDADCRPVPTWITAMMRHFEPTVGVVAGHVYEGGPAVWQQLRSLERLSVAALAAGTIGWGQGITATGGNLGYRRRVFQEVGGFADLSKPLSGDDDLFIQLVSRRTSWALHYAFEPEAAVITDPPATLRQFVAQERRRTSKSGYYLPWIQVLLVEVFLMNLVLALTLPFALLHPTAYPLPLIVFAGKVLCELLFLIKAGRLFKRTKLLRLFPLAVALHIPYFLTFAIWGTLGGYRWKAERPDQARRSQ